jgi:hypothetical protein
VPTEERFLVSFSMPSTNADYKYLVLATEMLTAILTPTTAESVYQTGVWFTQTLK